ncbi:efflux RND transporter permease subunit [Porcincola intestinalis]|nr:efflux RND transporter permease subunit [Porcincola intestinalis]MCI6767189.1 efflux RND transporter permease subunit [Lachnospiraceae bacterium]MDD7061158.1 efflux RND transporter permease subunit [Porcincola intestinalis]MDY5283535.1 efflux RND transporter permease subunit [Porcincola intestinalis]
MKGMKKKNRFGWAVVQSRFVILIAAFILLIPSVIGYLGTKTNYDMLSYLPDSFETMKGQSIMEDEFGTGGFSFIMVQDMPFKDVAAMKKKMEKVDHVEKVLWYDDFADISIPVEVLPDKIKDAFYREDKNETLLMVVLKTGTSSDESGDAIEALRKIAKKQCFISGMTAGLIDTKALADKEAPVYVILAVILCLIVLQLTMDSFMAPLLFLVSIGMAVLYNMGTNWIFGKISYVTKALAAVLQLGVTLDYSIFLWHSYIEQRDRHPDDPKHAMATAIKATLSSVIGSSITTVAGFLAMCFMTYRLGINLGLVMAKGVLFGVATVVTVLPALILVLDKPLQKTRHKAIIPNFKWIPDWVQKYYPILLVVFGLIWLPAAYGQSHTNVYYDLARTLPKSLPSVQANTKLEDDFDMSTTEMVLAPQSVSRKDMEQMEKKIRDLDGVTAVLGIDNIVGSQLPEEMIPTELWDTFNSKNWRMFIIMSNYKLASDEVNQQCDQIQKIIKGYDKNCMLVGEAPCTKDLIETTNTDFTVVNWTSIAMVAVIIFFVLQSVSLPVILVAAIEFAIFINMSIPFFMHQTLPFIASIVIGTIQLGSTVDYAILMTTRYKFERSTGKSRKESVYIAHRTSINSILVSALSFFGATFGVSLYSKIDMISSLCTLLARGALISMVTVVFILPALLYACDGLIVHTSLGFLPKKGKKEKAAGEASGEEMSAKET